MRKYINLFFRYFCYITTGTLLAVIIGFAVCEATPTLNTLIEVFMCAMPTTILTILAYNVKPENMNLPIRMLIHYVSICIVIVAMAWKFDWLSPDIKGIAFMCLAVAGVYAFVYFGSYISDVENAKSINKALEKKYTDN